MSGRRPLGASLPPDERLVAYERRIRELQAGVDELARRWQALDEVAADPRRGRRQVDHAAGEVRGAAIRLQEIAARPIRGPRRRPETVATS